MPNKITIKDVEPQVDFFINSYMLANPEKTREQATRAVAIMFAVRAAEAINAGPGRPWGAEFMRGLWFGMKLPARLAWRAARWPLGKSRDWRFSRRMFWDTDRRQAVRRAVDEEKIRRGLEL